MIKASVPGSLLIFGEHSVLRGKHAIVAAIDNRLEVLLEELPNSEVIIESNLGSYRANLNELKVEAPFKYILQVLKDNPPASGVRIIVNSNMSSVMGLGTSAAVVVATLATLMMYKEHIELDKTKLFFKARESVRKVQGYASGADIAASIWGGVSLFRSEPFLFEKLPNIAPLFICYSGYKTPTPAVIKYVLNKFKNLQNVLSELDNINDIITLKAKNCLKDPENLGNLFNISSGVMDTFGVHTKELSTFLWNLRNQSFGAKLSGSGLGDCAIGCIKEKVIPKGGFRIEVSGKGILLG